MRRQKKHHGHFVEGGEVIDSCEAAPGWHASESISHNGPHDVVTAAWAIYPYAMLRNELRSAP